MRAAAQSLLPQLARIAVWGTLAEDARAWVSIDGRAHLLVAVTQHMPGHPDVCTVQAVYHYPDHGAQAATAIAAHNAAHHLKRGAEVMVTGEGLYPSTSHGSAVLRLANVRSIKPISAYLAPAPNPLREGPHHVPA